MSSSVKQSAGMALLASSFRGRCRGHIGFFRLLRVRLPWCSGKRADGRGSVVERPIAKLYLEFNPTFWHCFWFGIHNRRRGELV